MTPSDLLRWIAVSGGVVHRGDAMDAGFPVPELRSLVRQGGARLIRRAWLASPDADPDLVTAAEAGGRLSCVTLARRRGWWVPDGVVADPHLHVLPGSAATGLPEDWPGRVHWAKPIGAAPVRALTATVHDALAHIARCVPPRAALVMWESAARVERLAPEVLRGIRWAHPAARELAAQVTGLSDSGLETLLAVPLRARGLRVVAQAYVAGRFADLLVGERLVVQADGYGFHADSAQRSRDIAHDAELRLRGYTVLRFSYAQIVHDRPTVERAIALAVAQGLHLAR